MAENNLQDPKNETPKTSPADASTIQFMKLQAMANTIKCQANTIKKLKPAMDELKKENQQLKQQLKSAQSIDTPSQHDNLPISVSLKKNCLEESDSKLLKDESIQNDINAAMKILNEKVVCSIGNHKKIYVQHINSKLQSAMEKLNHLPSEPSSSKHTCTTDQHSMSKDKPSIIKENSETSSTVQAQSDICGDADNEEKHVSNYIPTEDDCNSRKFMATIENLRKENSNLTSELKEMQLHLDRAVSGKLHAEEKVSIYKEQIDDKTKMFEAVMNMQKQSTPDSGSLLLKQQLKTFEDNILSDRDEKLRIQKENDDYKRRLSELTSQLTSKRSSEMTSENQQLYPNQQLNTKLIKSEPPPVQQWATNYQQQSPQVVRSTRGVTANSPQSCVDGNYYNQQQMYTTPPPPPHPMCVNQFHHPRRVIGFTSVAANNEAPIMMKASTVGGGGGGTHPVEQRSCHNNYTRSSTNTSSNHHYLSQHQPSVTYTTQQQPQKIEVKGRGASSSELGGGSSNQ